MKTSLLAQYRRSLDYELNRLGYSLDFMDVDKVLLEAEGKTLYLTFGNRSLKFDVFLAAKSLWNIPTRKLSPRELIIALGSI